LLGTWRGLGEGVEGAEKKNKDNASTLTDHFRCPKRTFSVSTFDAEAAAMSEPTVRFPVACPKCGREKLAEFPVDVVADALQRGSDICLVATCHDVIWTATELELEQIDEYLEAVQSSPLVLITGIGRQV
jgi:hypothetical protein